MDKIITSKGELFISDMTVECTEKQLELQFKSDDTIGHIESVLLDKGNINAILMYVDCSGKYRNYNVYSTLSKDRTGTHRIVFTNGKRGYING